MKKNQHIVKLLNNKTKLLKFCSPQSVKGRREQEEGVRRRWRGALCLQLEGEPSDV